MAIDQMILREFVLDDTWNRTKPGTPARLGHGARVRRRVEEAVSFVSSTFSPVEHRREVNAAENLELLHTAKEGFARIEKVLNTLSEVSHLGSRLVPSWEREHLIKDYAFRQYELESIVRDTVHSGQNLISLDGESLDFKVATKNLPILGQDRFLLKSHKKVDPDLDEDEIPWGHGVDTYQDAERSMGIIAEAIENVKALQTSLEGVEIRMNTANRLAASLNMAGITAGAAGRLAEATKDAIFEQAESALEMQANSLPGRALSALF